MGSFKRQAAPPSAEGHPECKFEMANDKSGLLARRRDQCLAAAQTAEHPETAKRLRELAELYNRAMGSTPAEDRGARES